MKQVVNSIAAALLFGCVIFLSSCGKQKVKSADFINNVQCAQTGVTYSVTNQTIKTNEYLELIVTVTTDDTSTIIFPDMITPNGFIPVDRTATQGKVTGAKTVEYSCRYTFEPTVPGDFAISPFRVMTVQNATTFNVVTSKVPITVKSLFAEDATIDIMDIEPEVSECSNNLIPIIIGSILLLGTVITYQLKKHNGVVTSTIAKQAEDEICKLNSSDVEFAHKLREICINYLEKQVEVDFGAASNEEVISKLEELRIFNSDIIKLVSNLLGDIYLAKYSKETVPEQELCVQALEFLARSAVSFEVSREFAEGEV